MDFDNPNIPRGPFENSEGHHHGGTKDNNELSFRVPSVPNSPSPAIINSQPESVRQRANEIHGSNSHVGFWNSSLMENQDRKPLCPPPLICLESQSNQSTESPVLNLATRNRHGSSTSTPVETPKVQSKGGLIRPIPSRLGSPFSPILSPGLVTPGSTGINSFNMPLLGKGCVTPTSKDLTDSHNNLKPLFATEVKTSSGSIEDYDSAFEDESISQEGKEESCSRTTPNNHKTIRKWRQHSHPGGVKNISKSLVHKNGQNHGDITKASNGFSRPSPFQPISIRTSSTVINETTHTSIPSPFDIDVNRLSPAGPLSAPSSFHWNNHHTGSLTHHRPNSTGGSTSSSSGCSSFLGGPFSPSDSLFTSPGSSASSIGNSSGFQSLSANSSSLLREQESVLEHEQSLSPFTNGLRRSNNQHQNKTPIFRRTTTTVLTKTETVTSPEGSISEDVVDNANISAGTVDLPNFIKSGIKLPTTSGNNIPVGIAVARQRTSTTTSTVGVSSAERNSVNHNDSAMQSVVNMTNNELNGTHNLVKIASHRTSTAETLPRPLIDNTSEKVSHNNTSNSDNALRALPVAPSFFNPWSAYPYIPTPATSTNDNFALQSAAASSLAAQAAMSPLGGYQVAKDPLTGQICFVPSPFNVPAQHSMLWPPSALAATLHHLSSPSMIPGPPSIPTLPTTYPVGLNPHQHQSYIEQLQRESQLYSTMTRNYSDHSALANLGFPISEASTAAKNHSIHSTEQDKPEQDQPLDLESTSSSSKRNLQSYLKKSLPNDETSDAHNKNQSTTNDTKMNDRLHPKNLVVKRDPYEDENSISQDSKNFQIDTLCKSDRKSHVPPKIELTNPITKEEKDITFKKSVSDGIVLPIHETDVVITKQRKCKIERKSISDERYVNENNSIEKAVDSTSLKPNVFCEAPLHFGKEPLIKIPVPFKKQHVESKDTYLVPNGATNSHEISTSESSQPIKEDLCNGLDILAEGIARLEKRKDSSDDSIHVDSRLSSPDFHSITSSRSLTSPLGMLLDAALLKADGQTTPIKGKINEYTSSEDEFLITTSCTGRSRSLDGQTVRKTSRRNSLCLSPDFGRGYRSPKAERNIKAFIASKSKRSFSNSTNSTPDGKRDSKDMLEGLTVEGNDKSPTNMTHWENEMRSNLSDIQKKYKEKYKELFKLDHQLKRIEAKNKKHRNSIGKDSSEAEHDISQITTTKHASPLPKKHHHPEDNYTKSLSAPAPAPSKSLPLPLHPDIIDAQLKEVNRLKESQQTARFDVSSKDPQITINELKTHSEASHAKKQTKNDSCKALNRDIKHKRSGRIVPIPNPPRTNTSHENNTGVNSNGTTTDLSAITSRFKVAKPNPFENLLKLSSKPSSVKSSEDDEPSYLKDIEENNTGKTAIRNIEVRDELDPLEENVIIPIVKPIRVKDVVDKNEESVHMSTTMNKSTDKSHYRKRMVETYILKKPKQDAETKKAKYTDSDYSSECTKQENSPEKLQKNAIKGQINANEDNLKHKKSSNLKFKVNSANNEIEQNHRKTNLQNTNYSQKSYHKESHSHSKSHEKKHIKTDRTIDENHELQELKLKKNKKSKKAKKEKRESKSDKSERKKMKVSVKKSNQNRMDLVDQRENINKSSDILDESISDEEFSSQVESAYSCIVKESDLDEGTRVLVKLDGHFYPGKILAISPPDIYGIIVDRERGNRPHIFPRDELLKEVIFEVKPKSRHDIPTGTRVCAYWSEKYHHLFPGTVSEDNEDPKDKNYINIELDDGDDRAIHIKNIRYLPPDYPIVSCDNDPLASVSRRRRRQSIENFRNFDDSKLSSQRSSIEDVAVEERIAVAKRARYEMEKVEKSPTKSSPTKSSIDGKSATGRLKFTFKTTTANNKQASNKKRELASNSEFKPSRPEESQRVVKPVASRSKLDGKHVINRQNSTTKKNVENISDSQDQSLGMAAFLPPQQLWRWSTKGIKRARGRILHREIERDEGETLSVGDCAIFLSTGRPDRPYVGRLESLWETSAGQMRVRVQWFYHASETEGTAAGGRRVEDLKMPGALFESSHFDENDIQTISHRCEVLPFSTYTKQIESDPSRLRTIYENNDLYYLAGQHDPIEGTIQFENDVLSNNH